MSDPVTADSSPDRFVAIDRLSKFFGDVRAVDDVSLDIAEGEFLALLGPSGSGKTTILMCVAGFEPVTDGGISIAGRDVTRVPPHKRDLGMVFQRYALFPHLTVAENIAFPLKMRSVPAAKRRTLVGEALELVDLVGLGERRPAQLSGGQQQRVALARAVVFGPSLLLMDEPLGALDKKLRDQLQIELKELQQRIGTTVIYVTHDQQEALTMADRIGVMNHGVLQQVGNPAELYESPVNAFVANFVGETTLLTGKVVTVEGGRCMVELDGGPAVSATSVNGAANVRASDLVQLTVRPERIRLSPVSANSSGITGRITASFYSGESTLYMVSLGTDAMVRVRAAVHEPVLRVGDEVDVDWPAEHARVYPT